MAEKRLIEIFTAGCYICEEAVEQVKSLACPSCEIKIYDLHSKCDTGECIGKARKYGIRHVPAVVINGELASCCSGGLDLDVLKAAGLGQPI
jgi:hypothetical protein